MLQSDMMPKQADVTVAYAAPHKQYLLKVAIQETMTVQEAIEASRILTLCPIDLTCHAIGIFGKCCRLADSVHAGDRIEIYRPLVSDPKEARRKRANPDI